jgi:MFS family permease
MKKVIFIFLFFLYGLYAAATEGIAKAWISNIADRKDVATAIGTYSGFQSIAALIASSLAGFIWFRVGAAATFIISATATLAVILYFSFYTNFSQIKVREKIT